MLNKFGIDIDRCWNRALTRGQDVAVMCNRPLDWRRVQREFLRMTQPDGDATADAIDRERARKSGV